MVEPVTGIVGGLSVSKIMQTVKDGANALREAKNLELYQRMMDVHGNVMDLIEENRRLVERVRGLEEELKIKGELSFDSENNQLWHMKDGKRQGPYCTVCWEVDKKLVHLHKGFVMDVEYFSCAHCDSKKRK